jgi:hypothetical protein
MAADNRPAIARKMISNTTSEMKKPMVNSGLTILPA